MTTSELSKRALGLGAAYCKTNEAPESDGVIYAEGYEKGYRDGQRLEGCKGDKNGDIYQRLRYAKNAVARCLTNLNCLVDMHGLTHWAGEVERLRKEVAESL
jgi:hypothetical protein